MTGYTFIFKTDPINVEDGVQDTLIVTNIPTYFSEYLGSWSANLANYRIYSDYDADYFESGTLLA